MDLSLIPTMVNALGQTCALALIVVAVLIVFILLARFLADPTWWPFR